MHNTVNSHNNDLNNARNQYKGNLLMFLINYYKEK
jgi:hypothetical protein